MSLPNYIAMSPEQITADLAKTEALLKTTPVIHWDDEPEISPAEQDISDFEAKDAADFDRERAPIGDTGPAIDYPPTPEIWHDAGLRSHQRIAKRFATYAEGHALYILGTGWHYWDGSRWAVDHREKHVHRLLERMLTISWSEAIGSKDLQADVRASMTSTGSSGVLDLASRKMFAPESDVNPWLLNCANGTLDLHTLELKPADPKDLITKVTRAAYVPGASSARWEQFLESSLPDPEVRDFLQRYSGLTLVGKVIEHILVIATGEKGRNGKSVFAETITAALGDYSVAASSDLLVASRHGGKSASELAQMMQLRGARLATMSELERGAKLAESTMKQLTGGDTVNAKKMGKDPINFEPSHMFLMLTNDLPEVDPRATAVWARMRVIPFDVSFIGREDVNLKPDLMLELESVLSWAVAGLAAFQAAGRLEAPEAVLARTAGYREENDSVAQFIAEECSIDPDGRTDTDALGYAYGDWQRANGKEMLTGITFGKRLKALASDRPEKYGAIQAGKSGSSRFWRGITIGDPTA